MTPKMLPYHGGRARSWLASTSSGTRQSGKSEECPHDVQEGGPASRLREYTLNDVRGRMIEVGHEHNEREQAMELLELSRH